jgi:Calx-beta domain
MYSINRLSRRARRAGLPTLFASFMAFNLLSGAVPTASAQTAPTTLSVDDVSSVNEGDVARFIVNVSGPHPTLTVDYQTQNGTAVDGQDFVGVSGTLTIADTDSSGEVDVSTIDDNVFEADETFTLKLLKKTSSFDITKAVGTAHLHSDDLLPTISITNERVTEPDAGSNVSMDFVVTASNPASTDVTVDYKTIDGTAVGGAGTVGPGDYKILNTGTLTFPAGTNPQRDVIVEIKGDNTHEDNEKFTVELSNAINSQLAGGGATLDATGTIVDNDPVPHISIGSSASITENDPGDPINMLGLDVKLTNPTNKDVTFTYDTSNGSAHENDYGVVTNGSGKIPAGALSTQIWITIDPDNRKEGDENFFVTIKDPVNANLNNATCEVTINDDD